MNKQIFCRVTESSVCGNE